MFETAIVLIAYYVAGRLGQATTSIRSGNLGPVWPAYGIALAAAILYGSRILPAIAAGAFLIAFLSPVGAVTALGQATSSTLAAFTGAFFLKRILAFDPSMRRLKDALALIFGAFGSALISSLLGTWVLYEAHITPYVGLGSAWLIYWLGDSTGVLLITPLAVTLLSVPLLRHRRQMVELASLILLLTASTFLVFASSLFVPFDLDFLAFGLLPFVIWAAIRFETSATALAVLIIASVATVETALGSGPFAGSNSFIDAVLLDVFFAVISVTGLILAGATAEKREAERTREQFVREEAVAEARLRLANIVESSEDAIIGADLEGTITDWNRAAELLLGYKAAEMTGKNLGELVSGEASGELGKAIANAQLGTAMHRCETVCARKDGALLDVSVRVSPIFDVTGNSKGASFIVHDITLQKRLEIGLRESEERFRLVANTAPVIIWMSDPYKLLYVNQRWAEFTGRSVESALGNGWTEDIHPEDLAQIWQIYEEAYAQRGPFHMEGRLRRHDGEYRWIFVSGVPRFNADGSFAGYIGSAVDVTERKRAEEALSNVSKKLIDAQEQEAARIARELHDDINQRLAFLAIGLDSFAQNSAASTPQLTQMITDTSRQLEDLAADIQALSHRIHSSKLEYLGLEKAAASSCREVSERQHVEVGFYSQEIPRDLPKETALCLFRVLQEALQNAIKHSGSRQILVSLNGSPNQIELIVQDSGVGFDLEEAMKGRGLGLTSMTERLKLVDGTLSIESQPHSGTIIRARVPLLPKTRSAGAT